MTGRRQAGIVRGALCIVLAYALFLHVVLAGLVAERMIFSRVAGIDALCIGATGSAPSDEHRPAPAGISHCIVCTFAKLTPVLHTPGPFAGPERIAHAAFATPRRESDAPRIAWRVPRLSQGPPGRTA